MSIIIKISIDHNRLKSTILSQRAKCKVQSAKYKSTIHKKQVESIVVADSLLTALIKMADFSKRPEVTIETMVRVKSLSVQTIK